jgi:AraC-like DNA-binding protein
MSAIAEHFHVPQAYMTKIFKAEFNVTPSKFMIDLLIKRAQKLLVDSGELSIKEISVMLGYTDQLYFSRLFKQIVGKSPVDYRTQPTPL